MQKLHGPFPPRTLQTLEADYSNFIANGSDLKKAKLFNNVIDEPLFKVPINQVNFHKFFTKCRIPIMFTVFKLVTVSPYSL